MTTLIVGCGYLGRRVGRLLRERGERVFGTTRNPRRATELTASGIEPVLADVLVPDSLDTLPEVERVLYCVGFDRAAGIPMRTVYVEGLRNVLAWVTGTFVYAGSAGVYGQGDGEWVAEESPTEPRHEAGRVCLDAERLAREFGEERGLSVVVLRFSGLYGPGRIPRRDVVARGAPIAGDPGKFLNLIHIEDAARAAIAALGQEAGGHLYLVTDDRPVARGEFYELVARHLGAPPPRFVIPEAGSPEAQREESNKRLSNRRMRTELGIIPRYPDIDTGIPAVLREEAGGFV